MFMEQLDTTILATALPTMARSFHVDPVSLNVAMTSYLLSLAIFIPASGQVADRFGSRVVFRAAIAIFTIGSALCGFATSLPMLVGSRMLQGLGGAMMIPVGRLLLFGSIPKSELIGANSWLLVPGMLGPVLGPPIGGLIVTYAQWNWIFWVNIPIGVLGLVLVTLLVQDMREPDPKPFDFRGLVLSGAALSLRSLRARNRHRACLVGDRRQRGLVAGLVCGSLYVAHARRHPHPVLDLRLLRKTTFHISIVGGTLFRIGFGALPFLLPLLFQLGFGLSAARSGAITFVSAASSMIMKEPDGQDVHALRISQRDDLEQPRLRRVPRRLRRLSPELADRDDLRPALRRRPVPLAAVQRLRLHLLCRDRSGGNERGDHVQHDDAAIVGHPRHRDFRGDPEFDDAVLQSRRADALGLHDRLPRRGGDIAAPAATEHSAARGCRLGADGAPSQALTRYLFDRLEVERAARANFVLSELGIHEGLWMSEPSTQRSNEAATAAGTASWPMLLRSERMWVLKTTSQTGVFRWPVQPSRRRMIEHTTVRNLSLATQRLHRRGFEVQPVFRPLARQIGTRRCPGVPRPSGVDGHLVGEPQPDRLRGTALQPRHGFEKLHNFIGAELSLGAWQFRGSDGWLEISKGLAQMQVPSGTYRHCRDSEDADQHDRWTGDSIKIRDEQRARRPP